MKRLFLLLVAIVALSCSCTKEEDPKHCFLFSIKTYEMPYYDLLSEIKKTQCDMTFSDADKFVKENTYTLYQGGHTYSVITTFTEN